MLVINTSDNTDQKRCNLCGKVLDFWDKQEDLTIHKDKLGYGTKYDGDEIRLQFCCECFDRIVSNCVVSPVIESGSGYE